MTCLTGNHVTRQTPDHQARRVASIITGWLGGRKKIYRKITSNVTRVRHSRRTRFFLSPRSCLYSWTYLLSYNDRPHLAPLPGRIKGLIFKRCVCVWGLGEGGIFPR